MFLWMLCVITPLFAHFSSTHLHELTCSQQEAIWEQTDLAPFNELIVSWDADRPSNESLLVYVSLYQDQWSPWLKYAEWGAHTQKTFRSAPEDSCAETYQDAASPKKGSCTAFRVKVTGADLASLRSLTACTAQLSEYSLAAPIDLPPVLLQRVPLQSQMMLNHPRHKDLCSPTSTTNAVNYLLGGSFIDPVVFASQIHDDEFDIYGNWILNTAQACMDLKHRYRCHVERMTGFADLHAKLMSGLPVVVSVKGTLPGAPVPYKSGHLICVVGYDPIESKVLCVDPAFETNEGTAVAYPLTDFLAAWGVRYNLAYVFTAQ